VPFVAARKVSWRMRGRRDANVGVAVQAWNAVILSESSDEMQGRRLLPRGRDAGLDVKS